MSSTNTHTQRVTLTRYAQVRALFSSCCTCQPAAQTQCWGERHALSGRLLNIELLNLLFSGLVCPHYGTVYFGWLKSLLKAFSNTDRKGWSGWAYLECTWTPCVEKTKSRRKYYCLFLFTFIFYIANKILLLRMFKESLYHPQWPNYCCHPSAIVKQNLF